MFFIKALLALALAAPALAAPALTAPILTNPLLQTRQCVETCGNTCYYQSTINEAVQQGYSYYRKGQTVGSGAYPHRYNNYEGFPFPSAGPYYEFPILSSFNPYTGGSPGADRVIFNSAGTNQGVITHTGAGGNDFLQCIDG